MVSDVENLPPDVLAYLIECPATPLSHIMGGHEKVASEPGRPVQVTVYVTRACNLRCVHCYIEAGDPLSDELSAREWMEVFRQLRDLSTEDLYILGGEPMMRRDIFDVISYASSIGLRVSMSTNGTLIGPGEAKRLASAGLSEVQVSIDGPNPHVNDSIRLPGSFRKAVEAVRHLKASGLRVTLAYVVNPLNYNKVIDMLRLAEELGVDAVTFEAVAEFGRARANGLRLPKRMGEEALAALMTYKGPVRVYFSSMRFYLPDLVNSWRRSMTFLGRRATSYTTCPAGRNRLVIDANGDVYGCELFMPLGVKEGNVRQRDLASIWRDGFVWIRNRLAEPPEACRYCPMVGMCGGGCPARAMIAHGTPYAPDPLCPLVDKRGKINLASANVRG
ncbi:MAG: radical SAM protein [Acidilobus sp.]